MVMAEVGIFFWFGNCRTSLCQCRDENLLDCVLQTHLRVPALLLQRYSIVSNFSLALCLSLNLSALLLLSLHLFFREHRSLFIF